MVFAASLEDKGGQPDTGIEVPQVRSLSRDRIVAPLGSVGRHSNVGFR
jgi:hypothetical protein